MKVLNFIKSILLLDKFPKGILLIAGLLTYYYSTINKENTISYKYLGTELKEVKEALKSTPNLPQCKKIREEYNSSNQLYYHTYRLRNTSLSNPYIDMVSISFSYPVNKAIYITDIDGHIDPGSVVPSFEETKHCPDDKENAKLQIKNLTSGYFILFTLVTAEKEVPVPLNNLVDLENYKLIEESKLRNIISNINNNPDLSLLTFFILFLAYLTFYTYEKNKTSNNNCNDDNL